MTDLLFLWTEIAVKLKFEGKQIKNITMELMG